MANIAIPWHNKKEKEYPPFDPMKNKLVNELYNASTSLIEKKIEFVYFIVKMLFWTFEWCSRSKKNMF